MTEPVDIFWLAACVAGVPVGYCLLRAVALAVTQKSRLQLAGDGEIFLARDDISEDRRTGARFWLDFAFDGRLAWAVALILPVGLLGIMVWVIVTRKYRPHAVPTQAAPMPEDGRLAMLGFVSMFGSAPIAFMVLALQMLVVAALAQLTRTFWVLSPSNVFDRAAKAIT